MADGTGGAAHLTESDSMQMRLQGLVLFLFIPLVLWLFVAQPGNDLVALLAGVAIMFGHRFIAAPFVDKFIDRRCVWSGAEIAPGCGYRVTSSGATRTFNSYTDSVRDHTARFFTFAQQFAWPLRIAILGPLAFYLVMEIARAAGAEVTSRALNLVVFQGLIGLTTLTTFIAYRFVKPIPHMKGPVTFPFPVHNVALLGIFWTLLVFAGVGAWWVYSAIMGLKALLAA
jgi:hypothetical protein